MPTQAQLLNSATNAPNCRALFEGLPEETRSAFEALEVKRSYPADFTLFTRGQAAQGVFVIRCAAARLLMSVFEPHHAILRTARKGDLLGLSATVSGEPYEVTAETSARCDIGFVARDDFLHFLRDHPAVTFRVVQVLSRNLNAILEQRRGAR